MSVPWGCVPCQTRSVLTRSSWEWNRSLQMTSSSSNEVMGGGLIWRACASGKRGVCTQTRGRGRARGRGRDWRDAPMGQGRSRIAWQPEKLEEAAVGEGGSSPGDQMCLSLSVCHTSGGSRFQVLCRFQVLLWGVASAICFLQPEPISFPQDIPGVNHTTTASEPSRVNTARGPARRGGPARTAA